MNIIRVFKQGSLRQILRLPTQLVVARTIFRTMSFYAVRCGKVPGVYLTWKECQEQVVQFSGAKYKKFVTREDAQAFIDNVAPSKTVSDNSAANNKRSAEESGLDSAHSSKQSKSDDEDANIVYADGASNFIGANQQAGIGVYWGPDDERNLSERLPGVHTKNGAEIQAACRVIEQAKELGLVNITLNSDNSILVKAASQWMAKWKRNDWKTSSKEDVKNKEDFQKLDSMISGIKIDWVQVTDKSIVGNKEAEKLAKAGVKKPLPGQEEEDESDDEYEEQPDGEHVVYTDGCCTNNGKDNSCAGIGVYWGPNDKRNVAEKLTGRQTNNRAEIHAACRAIQQAKDQGITDLTLKTDSRLVLKGATKWIKTWRVNKWKTTSKVEIKNKEDFQELDKICEGMNINWKHVKGHVGIVGNEEADRLANEGAKKDAPEAK